MKGDPSASMEVNTSIESPEFSFKVGRVFARTGKPEIALNCFTESLDKKLKLPTMRALLQIVVMLMKG
jgi:hypothetical protein